MSRSGAGRSSGTGHGCRYKLLPRARLVDASTLAARPSQPVEACSVQVESEVHGKKSVLWSRHGLFPRRIRDFTFRTAASAETNVQHVRQTNLPNRTAMVEVAV